ncbi:hypothetical protein VP01_2946g4 [Puccinia sorghi]|uniref:Uncharacterized protein n=1 Tax=Puccinia sorghi TaxID=27349 RepID=A0A0L6V0Z1_9BASI|nr:hypothetical protein VP01_2946g4 [Puccinia sorghi]
MDEDTQQDYKNLITRMFHDSDVETNQVKIASIFNHIQNRDCSTFSEHQHLMKHYLNKDAIYNNENFECCF